MILDWADAAYAASLRGDDDAETDALTTIMRAGRGAVDVAMRAWIDRSLMVMHGVLRQNGKKPTRKVGLEAMENVDTGETVPIGQVPDMAAWAGHMFVAHANRDRSTWEALWSTVPENPHAIIDHVTALLHSATATAQWYATESRPGFVCCHVHSIDPVIHADRSAMAHRN